MLNGCEYFHRCINEKMKCTIYNKSITDPIKTQNTTLMENQQKISIIYTSKQKDILKLYLAAVQIEIQVITSLTHFHRGKNKTNLNSRQTNANSTLLSHDQVHKSPIHSISQSFQGLTNQFSSIKPKHFIHSSAKKADPGLPLNMYGSPSDRDITDPLMWPKLTLHSQSDAD